MVIIDIRVFNQTYRDLISQMRQAKSTPILVHLLRLKTNWTCSSLEQMPSLKNPSIRIEIIRQYYVPGHTAYGKTFRRPPLCISHRNNREWRVNSEEPPPARAVLQRRFLNAYQAADDSQSCEVGRFFCFSGLYPRYRSPPSQFALFVPATN